jgi:hypothetical protein
MTLYRQCEKCNGRRYIYTPMGRECPDCDGIGYIPTNGKLTDAELQEVCHNLSEDDECAFKAGCREMWRKLGFEEETPESILDDHVITDTEAALLRSLPVRPFPPQRED